MKKFRLLGMIIGIVACIVGIYFYLSNDGLQKVGPKESAADIKAAEVEIEKSYNDETSKKVISKYDDIGKNGVIQEVHNMTHQKVYAKQKWGSSEITADKVLKLIEIVNSEDFSTSNTKGMLLAILEPWTRGDFSNAVSAHNKIWNYQNGSIGEATRLLTPTEELNYIEKKFR